jgi:hypothetical protein
MSYRDPELAFAQRTEEIARQLARLDELEGQLARVRRNRRPPGAWVRLVLVGMLIGVGVGALPWLRHQNQYCQVIGFGHRK